LLLFLYFYKCFYLTAVNKNINHKKHNFFLLSRLQAQIDLSNPEKELVLRIYILIGFVKNISLTIAIVLALISDG